MQLQQSYYDLSGPKSTPQDFQTHAGHCSCESTRRLM